METRNTHERTCITCPSLGRDGEQDRPRPNLYQHRWCCDDCRAQLPGLLIQIPRDYPELDPTPGNTHTERVTGSQEAPLGVRTSILDHLYQGPALTNPHLPWGPDQQGDLPAARTLYQIALSWLQARPEHLEETLPAPTVPELAKWLHNRCDWACNTLPENLPYHAYALSQLAHHLRLYTRGGPDKLEPIRGVECRECQRYSLARFEGDVICTHNGCKLRMSQTEYERWLSILAETERQKQHQRAA